MPIIDAAGAARVAEGGLAERETKQARRSGLCHYASYSTDDTNAHSLIFVLDLVRITGPDFVIECRGSTVHMLASWRVCLCFSAKSEHPAIKEVCARRCIAMRSADEQQLALIRPRRTPALPVAHLRLRLPALSAGPIGPHGAAVDAPIAPVLRIGRPDDLSSYA
eukprot:COSAG06_NODE_1070_length_10820_cov_4.675494_5_plen_165_part_00